MTPRLLTVQIRHEHDVVGARRRARQLAAALGFDVHEQTRVATAVSELARNAYQYAHGGTVEYLVEGATAPQVFTIRVSDRGSGVADLDRVLSGRYQSTTGMGLGIVGARRLMDAFEIASSASGTTVVVKKILPPRTGVLSAEHVEEIATRLFTEAPPGPIEEAQQQNQELLVALGELRARQDDLERVNRELEDTNRGVVALYAELEERADHLRRADDLKTRFLSNMTHEFRTPVNSILALTNLLRERLASDGEQKDELYYIRKSAQQLADLVDDLLDIAKVEAGKIDVHPAPFEIAALFGALRGMLRPLLANSSLTLVFEEPEGLPPIYSDESKVSQILRNFISNALKYTDQGEVRVSACMTERRDGVEFRVADTGIGIPAGDLARVFDEFVQIENPLQQRVKGTGLGLPLSKRLAELLGGTVSVTSTLGVGSLFSVTIPMAYRAGVSAAVGPLEPGRVGVLILEDSDEDLLLYERMLAGTRFQSIPVRSIAAAAAGLEVVRPAAIILDLRMHGQDSWHFLTRLKREKRTASIPVIIVSAVDDTRKGLALGAHAYAVKPVAKHWLLETLEAIAPAPSCALRVLTVDDEETHRFIIREMLNDSRYEVAEAGSGEDGLHLMHELPPDIVLLDLRLKDMSGIDFCDQLRHDKRVSRTPVILITSQALSDDERRRFGVDRVVMSKASLTREGLQAAISAAVTTTTSERRSTHA